MVKKLQYFFALALIVVISTSSILPPKGSPNAIKTIVIDPGHGGKDPGCSGVSHKEKDISLSVALKLGKYIEDNMKDVKVIYTRTTDVFVELEDRAMIANKAKADLFISIHCNAAGKPVMVKDPKTGKLRPKMYKNKKGKLTPVETVNPVPFGSETYVMGLKNEEGKMKVATRENSAIFYEDDYEKKYGGFDPESEESYIIMSNYTSAYVIQSANLAMKIQEEYAKKAGRVDKGVHRQSIWVLWRTSMPSVLTELGYLTNPLEETFLASEKGQEYMAKCLFRGLRKYKDEIEGTKKTYNDEFENMEPLENENLKAGNSPNAKREVEEESQEPEEKKDSVIGVVENNTIKPLVKESEKKEKADDDHYSEIELKKTDSAVAPQVKKDTALSAKEIAEKFKKETNETTVEKKEIKKEDPVVVKKEDPIALVRKDEILFKVQFASSDVPLNLKQEKFSAVADADFYRAGNVLKYTSGKFLTIKDAVTHQTLLREKGFKDCFIIAVKNGQRIDVAEAKKLLGQ